MDRDYDPPPELIGHLERCWLEVCDIDPMILRLRLLRLRGAWLQADCLKQELEPIF